MASILIAGCGYVGTVVGQTLADQGHTVYGLKRNPVGLPDVIRPLAGDISNIGPLELPDILDRVVISVAASEFTETAYRLCYLEGVGNLLGQLSSMVNGPDRLVFTSSTGVYGEVDGQWVTETSETHPSSFSGRIMLDAEAQIHGYSGKTTCLRLGGIYGPGRDRLIRQVRAAEVAVPADRVFTNRIHREDAARAICHVLQLEDPAPVYNVVDPNPSPIGEVLQWLSDRLEVPLKSAGKDGGFLRSRGGNKRVSSDRLQRSGFSFRYPDFRSGYGELLDPVG